ncbi:MAG: hypothetical protein ACTS73_02905 [Arsenophonus sp. NEOnobi-MAG3]
MKQQWLEEHKQWCLLGFKRYARYVYFLADGIYTPVRKDDRLCLLVIYRRC